jgi:hypothetical protein
MKLGKRTRRDEILSVMTPQDADVFGAIAFTMFSQTMPMQEVATEWQFIPEPLQNVWKQVAVSIYTRILLKVLNQQSVDESVLAAKAYNHFNRKLPRLPEQNIKFPEWKQAAERMRDSWLSVVKILRDRAEKGVNASQNLMLEEY